MSLQVCLILTKDGVNIAGVAMATIGACLLWYFVVDVVTINREEILAGKQVTQTIPVTTPELIRRLLIQKYMTRLGVFLTVFGGVLQVASSCMT